LLILGIKIIIVQYNYIFIEKSKLNQDMKVAENEPESKMSSSKPPGNSIIKKRTRRSKVKKKSKFEFGYLSSNKIPIVNQRPKGLLKVKPGKNVTSLEGQNKPK
jgi:hypothetical protein